jgi:coiled-coil domain-containing protein 12
MEGDARKDRLKALKERAAKKGAGEQEEQEDVGSASQGNGAATLTFRNYAVKDSRIKHTKVEQSRVDAEDVPVAVDVERAVGEQLEDVIANVAPKKPNWDLRKEIAGKLAKLERRTQGAIAELAVEEEKKRMAGEA